MIEQDFYITQSFTVNYVGFANQEFNCSKMKLDENSWYRVTVSENNEVKIKKHDAYRPVLAIPAAGKSICLGYRANPGDEKC